MTDPTPHVSRSPVEHEHNTCPLGEDCDLTLAYMAGFHKRDDEVAALMAEIEKLRARIAVASKIVSPPDDLPTVTPDSLEANGCPDALSGDTPLVPYSLLARAERERDEARRRRDEWRKKAEGYDAVRLALREKVGAPWPTHMSRALWAGIAADEKKRADDAEAERDALRAAIIEAKRAADEWAISRATGHQGLEGEKADKLWKALRNMRAVADGPIAASASIVQEVEGRDG